MSFDVNVRERILRPVDEVFDAVVDPAKMSQYFISSASGPIEEGRRITWAFDDVGTKVEIDVISVKTGREIVYESSALGQKLRTTITFEADGADATVVTIKDSSFEMTDDGVKRALGQNAGWTYTLCGLKAYVQFGINLRRGLNKRLTDV
jgi:uncharacterized protein YndB with AHSA1/START domain